MPASHFIGEVRTEWLTETGPDRLMQLIDDFTFVDPRGKRWDAPAGRKINGASIPPILWSVAGSPFTGDYRRASVVHDVACQDMTKPSKAVHRMFYDAMVCDGVSEAQAVEFYAAVRLFGPSWSMAESATDGRVLTAPRPRKPTRTIAEVETALDAVLGE